MTAVFQCPDCFDAGRIRDPQSDEYRTCPNCVPLASVSLEAARLIVAGIPPQTDAECDAAALDYAQTRLSEVQAQLETLADEVDGWQTTGTIPELEAYRRGQRSVAARIRVIARG